MQGARNGPRMDEDPVRPRHGVAGGPVGYKHGMRDGQGCGTGHTTAPWERETTGRGDWAGDGMWRRGTGHGMGWETVGSGSHSPWSGELWANHGEPGNRNSENDLNSGTAVRCPQG